MSAATAYAAQTVHLAAAIIRHAAEGLDLIGNVINPAHVGNIEAGRTRRRWCEQHRVWEATATIYQDHGDPTKAVPVGEWIDCDSDDDEDEEA